MPDKEIQIEVLLYGDAYKLSIDTLHVPNMKRHQYSKVFTVTAEEVYNYVAENGLLENKPVERSVKDGFYYYQTDDKWFTFFRERGNVFDEKTFDDFEIGRKYIVLTLLKLSGTGLY